MLKSLVSWNLIWRLNSFKWKETNSGNLTLLAIISDMKCAHDYIINIINLNIIILYNDRKGLISTVKSNIKERV